MTIALLNAERRWVCPNCAHTRVTISAEQHVVIHRCRGLGGLTAPLVLAGTHCKVEVRQREDYTCGQLPQVDDAGRVVMSVITTRDDGQDCTVFAPTATLRGGAHGLD